MSNKGNTLVNNTNGGDPISNTVQVAGNIGEKTLDTAGGLAEKGIDTTVDVAKSLGSGVKDLAEPGVEVVADGAREIGSAAKSGAEYAGSALTSAVDTTGKFIGNVLTTNPTDVAASQASDNTTLLAASGSNTQVTPGTSTKYDVYSYYGQLPEKQQASYIPLTADFSSFSK